MHGRRLHTSMILSLAVLTAAIGAPSAGAATTVCNEAENSPRGGYVVLDPLADPNPPAFLRGSQMRVGNGNGEGLENAAAHSPALQVCVPKDADPTDEDPS